MTEPTVGERLARIETDIGHLKDESRAIRETLHELIRTALADHSAAITRLATAHDTRLGVWWTLVAGGVVLVALAGAIAWLLENQVQIIVKK